MQYPLFVFQKIKDAKVQYLFELLTGMHLFPEINQYFLMDQWCEPSI